jgi:hypothetical protein
MHRYSVLALLHGFIAAAFLASLVLLVPESQAQTADGQPPAIEQVCDGKTGALWGLCVAYCEAMDCDYPFPHASDEACDHVLGNYLKKSGGDLPPCEESGGEME